MYEWGFWQKSFTFMFVLLYRVCTHVRLSIFATELCVYVCAVVEGMHTCKTGNFV